MKKSPLLLCLLLVCTLLLAGCSLKNETLDAQMEQVLDALDQNDEEAFVALFYPGIQDKELRLMYSQFRDVWTPLERDQIKLVSYSTHSAKAQKDYRGLYQLPRSDEYSHLEINYLETEDGRGLVGLKMGKLDEAEPTKPGGWQLVYFVLYLAFLILTIIDIIRKKPLKYGWLIVMALIYFSFRTNTFSIMIPLGSILYWCLRGKLLREKAMITNPPVSYPVTMPKPESPTAEPGPAVTAEQEHEDS